MNNGICGLLENNVLKHYEDLYGKKIYDDIKEGKIKPFIECTDSTSSEILSPYARENGTICIDRNFVDFLWAYIYGSWVQFEEGLMKGLLIAQGKIDSQDAKEISLAQSMLHSAITHQLNPWPTEFPLPNANTFYTQRVNGIFLDAISILLFHETAHILNGHLKIVKNCSSEEKKELEKEADNFALQHVFDDANLSDQSTFIQKSIAIITAFTSFLFAGKTAYIVRQSEHPDLDDRLFNAMQILNIKDNHISFYMYSFADTIIRHFYEIHKGEYQIAGKKMEEEKKVDFAKDLFLKDIEIIKI